MLSETCVRLWHDAHLQLLFSRETVRVGRHTHTHGTCATHTQRGCTRCQCAKPWCPKHISCDALTPCLLCPVDYVNSQVRGRPCPTGRRLRHRHKLSKVYVLKINLKIYIPVSAVTLYKKHWCILKSTKDKIFTSVAAIDISFVTIHLQYFLAIFTLMSDNVSLFLEQVFSSPSCLILKCLSSPSALHCPYQRSTCCRLKLSPFVK